MMNRLYYLGKPADGFGWGVANANLVRELSKLCDVVVDQSDATVFDAPVFVPVADSHLRPLRRVRAPRILGYCFTEWPLANGCHTKARLYDCLFSGSTWNSERLAEKGIKSETLIQGVDFERFTVQPPSERKGFVVFSGGKLEFRKGQDYVIAAMRQFMKYRADVTLVTAWHNPWPQSMASMANSWLVDPNNTFEGLPVDRVIRLPAVPNEKLPAIYAQANIGVFPNRCEAGTNMVMCEFMATGRPVIASFATGMKDVFYEPGQYLLTHGSYDPAGWFNPNVSDILTTLEHAYENRQELPSLGLQARKLVERFTWSDCARKIFKAAFPAAS